MGRPSGVELQVVGTLQRAHPVVGAADQVRRRPQQLEVGRSQRHRFVGDGQRRERIEPAAPPVGLAAAFEFVDGLHA